MATGRGTWLQALSSFFCTRGNSATRPSRLARGRAGMECLEVRLALATTGLVAHWNFDEGPDWHDDAFHAVSVATAANDTLGFNHLELRNMTTDDWVSGRQFTALEFDGIDDYLGASRSLADVLGTTASLAFWIRTSQTGVNTPAPGVAGVEPTSGVPGNRWGWIDETGRIGLQVGAGSAAKSSVPINDLQWHHVVLTRDVTTGLQQVYVDGTLQNEAVGDTGPQTNAFHSIGRIEGGGGYFQGRLDQIHLFERVIDEATIHQLRDNHAPKGHDVSAVVQDTTPTTTQSVLFKAYDVELDTLSVASHTNPSHGAVVNNDDGTFTYTADSGFHGRDFFDVVIRDSQGGFDTITVTLDVVPSLPPSFAGSFTDFQPLQANGIDISLAGMRTPRGVDWDQDGDNDLLVGHQSGTVWLYLNTGTPELAQFAAGTRVQAAGANIALPGAATIALADMTGDGVDDLVVVDANRRLRVYRNTSATNQTPQYAAATIVPATGGGAFTLPDQRFDLADVNGDGKTDVIVGTFADAVRVFLNRGSSTAAQFDPSQSSILQTGAYNLYPRVVDLNGDGKLDYVRGINWGNIRFWTGPDFSQAVEGEGTEYNITTSDGNIADVRAATDGAIVDLVDFNGDGVKDLVLGGHAGSTIHVAYGVNRTPADVISDMEAIYDNPANQTNLHQALEANGQDLLSQLKSLHSELATMTRLAPPDFGAALFAALKAHVEKYSFLRMGSPLNPSLYGHLAGTASQYFVTMRFARPDTPDNRAELADIFELQGWKRNVFLDRGVLIGDNQQATENTVEAYYNLLIRSPYDTFPDSVVTVDNYFGAGRGAFVDSFTSAKNTFPTPAGVRLTEMPQGHREVIANFTGSDQYQGDYAMAVLAHEVHHSLDAYVRGRANQDLVRRWGQMLVYGGGPDIVAGPDGWYDQAATQSHWASTGLYNPSVESWDTAWNRYWNSGAGSLFQYKTSYKNEAPFRLTVPQETLAGLANFNWDYAEGNLITAVAWYREAVEGAAGIAPQKAAINDAVTFLDFRSLGMNKVFMPDTEGRPGGITDWSASTLAYLERNDDGLITKITIEDRIYEFGYDSNGLVTEILAAPQKALDDVARTSAGTSVDISPLSNDVSLLGTPAIDSIVAFTSPSNGTVTQNGGTLRYSPNPGFRGIDTFTYTSNIESGPATATITVRVDAPDHHWKLDEGTGSTAQDAVGFADGMLRNINQLQAWVDGKIGTGALNFDGRNDRVLLGTAPSLDGLQDFTVSAWVKTTSSSTGTIIQQRDNNFNGQYWLRTNANGTVNFALYGDSAFQFNLNTFITINDGNWHHVAVQRDGNAGRIYIDGALAASGSGTARNLRGSIAVALGADIRDNNAHFDGTIDDVRIYKTVIAPSSISALGAEPPALVGDFNSDGAVNLGDYSVWRDNLGASVTAYQSGDGDGDGLVTAYDYRVWKDHFGETLPVTFEAVYSAEEVASASSALVVEATLNLGDYDAYQSESFRVRPTLMGRRAASTPDLAGKAKQAHDKAILLLTSSPELPSEEFARAHATDRDRIRYQAKSGRQASTAYGGASYSEAIAEWSSSPTALRPRVRLGIHS